MRTTVTNASKLLGLTTQTIHSWIAKGLVPSEKRGRQYDHILDARSMVALAMVRTLRGQRVSLPTIGRLAKYLATVPTAEMLAAFDRGETLLVSAGELLPPRLTSPTQMIANRSGADTLLVAFDLGSAFNRIKAALENHAADAAQAVAASN